MAELVIGFIFFALIVILPYGLYTKKKYEESNDKELFLKENLYRSTVWILLLVALPIFVINAFFIEKEAPPAAEGHALKTVDEYKKDRVGEIGNIDFHFQYLNRIQIEEKYATDSTDLKEFYFSVIESGYSDIGNWALGFYYANSGSPHVAGFYLERVQDQTLKYLNLTKAKIYQQQGHDSLSAQYLIREVLHENGAREHALIQLSILFDKTRDLNLLHELIGLPDYIYYVNFRLIRTIFLLNFEIANYTKVVLMWFKNKVNVIDVLAAILILLVWATFLVKLAFFEKINWAKLVFILLLGMVFSLFTFLISDILEDVLGIWQEQDGLWSLLSYSIFGIGAVEELVKIIPLLLALLFSTKKLQPYHYLLFACISALGFAFMENLIYFDKAEFGSIIHGRALTSAVGHMMFSSVFAYGLVLSKFRYKKLPPFAAFFVFWFLASLAHGFYDFWLFADLIILFIPFFFMIARIWITLLNNAINNNSEFVYSKEFQTSGIQFYLAFSLTAILMFEYVLVAYLEGPGTANRSIIGAAFSGSFLIMFLGSKLSSINLIQNYWAPINYSVNPFTDDIVSQNFIGKEVWFNSYYSDRGLIEFLPDGVKGTIEKRLVLKKRTPTWLFSYDDPEWFVIKLDKEICDEKFHKSHALIKFKELHSSLNAKKFFLVNFLLIPKKLLRPKRLRKNFHSLGWVFLRTSPHLTTQEISGRK